MCRGEEEAVFSVVAGFDQCMYVCARARVCARVCVLQRDETLRLYPGLTEHPLFFNAPSPPTPLVRSLPAPLTTIL